MVKSQPDILVGTPTENKQVFDNYPDLLANKLNQLIAFMDSDYLKDYTIDDSVVAYYKNTLGMSV
ncbi:MAG: hypothetical protein ACOCPD_01795 [Segatella copri]